MPIRNSFCLPTVIYLGLVFSDLSAFLQPFLCSVQSTHWLQTHFWMLWLSEIVHPQNYKKRPWLEGFFSRWLVQYHLGTTWHKQGLKHPQRFHSLHTEHLLLSVLPVGLGPPSNFCNMREGSCNNLPPALFDHNSILWPSPSVSHTVLLQTHIGVYS